MPPPGDLNADLCGPMTVRAADAGEPFPVPIARCDLGHAQLLSEALWSARLRTVEEVGVSAVLAIVATVIFSDATLPAVEGFSGP
jgi:hypothetical protein